MCDVLVCLCVCTYARAQVCMCACGASDRLCLAVWELLGLCGTRPCLGSSLPLHSRPRCCRCQAGIPHWPAGMVWWLGPRALLTSGQTTPGPGGLGSPTQQWQQALGQLVAISSADYLVAMPSGVRALSPDPRIPCLLAYRDFWG